MESTTDPDPPEGDDRSPGETLGGRFRLEARLGRGGFGDVWRASELLPDGSVVRQVALKLLSPDHAGADWAREARVLASLRHPSLVTIFSAGLLDLGRPTPFVAMELLEGRTLAELLAAQGRVAFRRALFFVREIAGALDAIHAQGIIHLDLKPSNLLLGPDGVVRVLDFGIARHRGGLPAAGPAPTQAGGDDPLGTAQLLDLDPVETAPASRPSPPGVAGTPGFLAPEVIEGREASPSADAYALGACLFQLLTGRLPQRARPVPPRGEGAAELAAWRAEIRASTVAGDLEPLAALAPRTPPAVAALCERLLALDPASRPAPTELLRACEEAYARPFGTPDPPYLGLRAYGRGAEGFLFGREADSERLGRELAARQVLVLQGASGSGKSSLAVAGVVPALARAFVDGCDDWVAAVVRPGQDIDAAVRRARDGAGAANVGVALVVDQLEELSTQLGPEQNARFVLALLRHATPARQGASTAPTPGLRVLCTLREDFTTRVASLGSLGPLLEDAVRFVPPPSAASVRDIVTAPAALSGVRVDDDRPIVDDVLKELRSGEGRLPLVSFALGEWWQTREGSVLSAAAWRRIGGVTGALSRHADATLSRLSPEARAAARDLCLRLVTPEGTRARVPAPELRALSPLHALSLDAFLEARLLALDDAGSASFSHEALLVAWGALAAWIEEERADRVLAAGLVSLAQIWRAAAGPDRPELVLGGARLARATELAQKRPDLAAPFQDLIGASRSRALRERVLKNGLLLLLLAAAGGAILFYALETHEHERDIREREQNLVALVAKYDQKRRDELALEEALNQRRAELSALKHDVKSCRDAAQRIEQEHRAALSSRFAPESFEARVVTFLLQWEHVWNLHDPARIGSFYADDVSWLGQDSPREELVRQLEDAWRKSPSNRMLIGEVTVTHKEGDEVHIRMTREERQGGTQNLSVTQLVVRGEKPDAFRIEKGSVEKVIVSGKPLGCP